MNPSRPSASVVVVSKNRRDCLGAALASAVEQGPDVEVIYIDDGSTDGSSEMVATRFPTVRRFRDETSRGVVAQRSRGARLARGPVVFSIDDDATFTTPHLVRQVLAEFDHPRIGMVAIPFCHTHQGPREYQRTPDPSDVWLTTNFLATSYAVRRDVFLAINGYRNELVRQGEERDLAIRMLAAGFVIRLGNSDRIDHTASPIRSYTQMDRYGRCNDIRFAWQNLPLRMVPVALARYTLSGLLHGLRVRRPWNAVVGLAWGYGSILSGRSPRAAVPHAVWTLFRRLRSPQRLRDLEPLLPPMADLPHIPPSEDNAAT